MSRFTVFLLMLALPASIGALSLQTGGSYVIHSITLAADEPPSFQDGYILHAGVSRAVTSRLSAGTSLIYSRMHPAPYDTHMVLRGYSSAGVRAFLDLSAGSRRLGVTLFGSGLWGIYEHTPLLFFSIEAGTGLFFEFADLLPGSLSLRLAVNGIWTERRDIQQQAGIGAELSLVRSAWGRSRE